MATSQPNKSESRRADYTGEKFGKLTVIKFAGSRNSNRTWECLCDCGTSVIYTTTDLLTSRCRSCRCQGHNRKHRQSGTPEYIAWRHIKSRCFDPGSQMYHWYGARGITMCEAWRNSFEAFYAHVGSRPTSKHSIDRIDNNGHYEPGNVRWATKHQQSRNTRQNIFVTFAGKTQTLRDWSDQLKIPFSTFRNRVKKWGDERAITTPHGSSPTAPNSAPVE